MLATCENSFNRENNWITFHLFSIFKVSSRMTFNGGVELFFFKLLGRWSCFATGPHVSRESVINCDACRTKRHRIPHWRRWEHTCSCRFLLSRVDHSCRRDSRNNVWADDKTMRQKSSAIWRSIVCCLNSNWARFSTSSCVRPAARIRLTVALQLTPVGHLAAESGGTCDCGSFTPYCRLHEIPRGHYKSVL